MESLSLSLSSSNGKQSRSTDPSQSLESMYQKKPAVLSTPQPNTPTLASLALTGSSFPDDFEVDTPKRVESKRRKRDILTSQLSSEEDDDEQSNYGKLNAKLDMLISHHHSFTNMIVEKISDIEKKLDKLQTDVAFLGSRASEGRPIMAPVYPFGESSALVSKPSGGHRVPDLDVQKSWDDLGL